MRIPMRQRRQTRKRRPRQTVILCAILAVSTLAPASGLAQSCVDCAAYAVTDLNLRQWPDITSAALRVVPTGGALYRTAGDVTNGYAPVTYDQVPGWVVAPGIVTAPDEVDASASPDPSPLATRDDLRATLAPLMLREGPSLDAAPLDVLPEGAVVTLTGEGVENGYITIDQDGRTGWVYADFLGEVVAS